MQTTSFPLGAQLRAGDRIFKIVDLRGRNRHLHDVRTGLTEIRTTTALKKAIDDGTLVIDDLFAPSDSVPINAEIQNRSPHIPKETSAEQDSNSHC
jgi:hypothetical protein